MTVIQRVYPQKSSRWCYTYFPTEPWPELYYQHKSFPQEGECDFTHYEIFQLEKCPESGKYHIQGYIELQKSVSLAYMKARCYATTHLEVARGTQEQNIAYCSKSDTAVPDSCVRIGEPVKSNQGKRNDLYAVKNAIDQGHDNDFLYEHHFPSMIRYKRNFDEYRNHLVEKEEVNLISVFCIYSKKSGTGKSHLAESYFGKDDTYISSNDAWFEGYERHKCLVLDDFHGHTIQFSKLKRYLDVYKVRLPVKGSSVARQSELIVITTNDLPAYWYTSDKIDVSPILRRINFYIFKPDQDTALYFFNYESFSNYVIINERN